MSPERFQYSITDHADFRLIRTLIPSIVTDENLSVAVWRYLALYETELPFAVISDYSEVEVMAPEAITVLGIVIEKSYADPRLKGAAWVVGDNEYIAGVLKTLLESLSRDPGLVVRTHAEALTILRDAGLNVDETP